MELIINIVLPVFGLIGIGYVAAWLRVLPDGTDSALADFVFTIALPLLLFRTVVTADFSHGSPWLLWAGYFPALGIIWVAGTLVMRGLFGRDARAGLVGGVSASYSNTLLVGLPLVLTAYGSEGTVAMSILIAVHLVVMMAVSSVLIERALVTDKVAEHAGGTVVVLRNIGRNLLMNPLLIGIVAGNIWNVSDVPLPHLVDTLVNRIADIAATLALFSMGMTLRRFGVRGNIVPAIALSVLKLVVMPALVLGATLWFTPLPPVWAKAMVIAAACPTGVNVFVIAARFRTGEALSSNTITLTTAAAVVTVAIWLHILDAF